VKALSASNGDHLFLASQIELLEKEGSFNRNSWIVERKDTR